MRSWEAQRCLEFFYFIRMIFVMSHHISSVDLFSRMTCGGETPDRLHLIPHEYIRAHFSQRSLSLFTVPVSIHHLMMPLSNQYDIISSLSLSLPLSLPLPMCRVLLFVIMALSQSANDSGTTAKNNDYIVIRQPVIFLICGVAQ